jgi:hypothetical protein
LGFIILPLKSYKNEVALFFHVLNSGFALFGNILPLYFSKVVSKQNREGGSLRQYGSGLRQFWGLELRAYDRRKHAWHLAKLDACASQGGSD